MRRLSLSIFFLFLAALSSAQNNLVTVIATGDGNSETQAINRALRIAIEKTFGVFISASTQIKNDELISDEIASVASGNIASYDMLSSIQNGSSFIVSVKALISPEKVVFNLKNAGQKVELNGSVFAQNILVEKFYKDQEVQVIKDFIETYKNLNIIDSFFIYPCQPFFMQFPEEGNTNDILQSINENFGPNRVSEIVKTNICFDGLTMNLQGIQYAKEFYKIGNELRTHFKPSFVKISNRNQFVFLDAEDQYKLFYSGVQSEWPIVERHTKDMSGGNYLLPIIYRPFYNVSNAVNLTIALVNLLDAISIKDLDTYKQKLGKCFDIRFIGLDKVKPLMGPFTNITNTKPKLMLRLYDVATKNYSAEFSLRNAQSIPLLKNYFDHQFQRSSPNTLYVSSNLNFSKILHLALTHQNLKTLASFQYYNEPLIINIAPSNGKYGELSHSIFPSVVLIRLTLEDLEKFKSINFSFEPAK